MYKLSTVLYTFGSNGRVSYSPEPVTERFTMRENKLNPHVKSIVCLQNAAFFIDPHHVYLKEGYNKTCEETVAQINHYFTKSRDEFILKIARGRADIVKKRQFTELSTNVRY